MIFFIGIKSAISPTFLPYYKIKDKIKATRWLEIENNLLKGTLREHIFPHIQLKTSLHTYPRNLINPSGELNHSISTI